MAISVLLGPGIKLVAPIKLFLKPLFTTTSSRIIEMWAAGPPKPINPNFKKSAATLISSLRSSSIVILFPAAVTIFLS
jgi:hypothetical protein